MQPFFSSDSSLKTEIKRIYNLGNSRTIVNKKKFEIWDLNDCYQFGFDGGTVIQYNETSDWKEHKKKELMK